MIISRSPADTFEFGRRHGESASPGTVFALWGDLGAGKTEFVKGLAVGMHLEAEVTSPTYTLIHEYSGRPLPLYHVDLYRLENAAEAAAIGLDEYLEAGGVVAIEWADKFPKLLPKDACWIHFRHSQPEEREIVPGELPA